VLVFKEKLDRKHIKFTSLQAKKDFDENLFNLMTTSIFSQNGLEREKWSLHTTIKNGQFSH
jgi:hypothetical protein